MDILDTSILNGVKQSELKEIAQRRQLAVSAVSLWEILCHLDEENKKRNRKQNFDRAKFNILKAKGMKILGLPSLFQLVSTVNPDVFMEPEVVMQMFDALENSHTLE